MKVNHYETTLLVQLAVLAALGKPRKLRNLASSSQFRRVPQRKIVETLLEVHLFAGFPAAIEGFAALSPVLTISSGNPDVMPLRTRRKRGENLCRRVYGMKYAKLIEAMNGLNSDLSNWMVEDGYGKVLSRPGLSIVERELIAVAVLAALGWKRQLASHVRGALNVGVTSREMLAVCKAIGPHITGKRANMLLFLTELANLR